MKKTERTTDRRLILLAVVGILLLTSLACSSVSTQSATDTMPAAKTAAPTKTKAAAKTEIPADQPTAEPTQEPAEATEATGGEWPLILRETFDSNNRDWFVGPYDGTFITETVSFADGKYTWNAVAKDSIMDYASPALDPLEDCYVSVEGRQISGSEYAEYGLIIRQSDAGDYSFGIDEGTGEFYFGIYYDEDYTFLIDYTESDTIRQGGVNTLAVEAVGSHFTLYINGEQVGEADDATLSSGVAAVMIALDEKDDTAIIEFDNFEVYAP
jgi:hypothetical protein